VVVAAVGGHPLGPAARPADATAYRRDPLEERDQLGDVVAVAARERVGVENPNSAPKSEFPRPTGQLKSAPRGQKFGQSFRLN
jgi:hypothetical protein